MSDVAHLCCAGCREGHRLGGRTHATRLDSGADVREIADMRLDIHHTQAWDLSNTHDLRVIEAERARRAERK